MGFAVFITAEYCSLKNFNKIIVLLRDYEGLETAEDQHWIFIRSTDPSKIPTRTLVPPVTEIPEQNDFANFSAEDVKTFMKTNKETLQSLSIDPSRWIVIDQKGLETSTCLLTSRYLWDPAEGDPEDEDYGLAGEPCSPIEGQPGPGGLVSEWRTMRVPFEHVGEIAVNLEIANMDFTEFVDEEKGKGEVGVYSWKPFDGDEDLDAMLDIGDRKEVLEKLVEDGWIDDVTRKLDTGLPKE